jgi:hypothetical protein
MFSRGLSWKYTLLLNVINMFVSPEAWTGIRQIYPYCVYDYLISTFY